MKDEKLSDTISTKVLLQNFNELVTHNHKVAAKLMLSEIVAINLFIKEVTTSKEVVNSGERIPSIGEVWRCISDVSIRTSSSPGFFDFFNYAFSWSTTGYSEVFRVLHWRFDSSVGKNYFRNQEKALREVLAPLKPYQTLALREA